MRQRLKLQPLDIAACLGFLSYAASATVTPIALVQMSRELGFGLTGGGALEAARSLLIFCTLLGSGFLAAHIGKARALGGALLLLAVGMALYGASNSYAGLILALAVAGIGCGVVEALINPLVEELHRDDAGRYLNTVNAFWSIGVLGTMVLGGDLLTRTGAWRPLIFGVSLLSLLNGLLFFALRRLGPPRVRIPMADVLGHKKDILRHPGFWLFSFMMFFGGAAEGSFTFWAASYLQLVHGATARMAGVGTACFAVGMILTRLAGGWWIRQAHLSRFLLGSVGLGLGVSLLFPHLPAGWMTFTGLFFAGVAVASFWPSLQALAVETLDLDATSLFILLSCGGISGFTFSSWFLGLLGARHGLRTAFLIIPIFFLLLGLLLLAALRRTARKPQNP